MAVIRNRRVWLAAAMLAACALPPAGLQLRIVAESLFGSPPGRVDRDQLLRGEWPERLSPQAIARREPNDAAIQVAAADASAGPLGRPNPDAMRKLADRFPEDRLALAAAVLADIGRCPLGRPDLAWPLVSIPGYRGRPRGAVTPEARLLEADAARGERIDPGNALFPFARAHALFAQRRDAEALTAIERGAHADRWDDYGDRRAHGAVRLMELQAGPTSALERGAQMAVSAGRDFAHFAQMRELTRSATGWAIQLEGAGRNDDALRIRVSLERWGGLLRRDAHTAVGSMVGMAVEAIALAERRPAGSAVAATPTEAQRAARDAARVARLQARLNAWGRPDLAAGLAKARTASRETRATIKAAMDRDAFGISRLIRTTALRTAVCACILGLAWALALAALARARSCRTRARAWRLVLAGAAAAVGANGIAMYRTIVASGALVDGGFRPWRWDQVAPALFVECLALIVPAAAVIASAIVRGRTRRPFSACLRSATPAVAILTGIGLVGALWSLSAVDAAATRSQNAVMRHEGRAYAAFAGRPWPDAVMPKL